MTWARFWLFAGIYVIACYAFGIGPAEIPAALIHSLTVMHNTAITGQHH